jgi:hypothetical protein
VVCGLGKKRCRPEAASLNLGLKIVRGYAELQTLRKVHPSSLDDGRLFFIDCFVVEKVKVLGVWLKAPNQVS